MKRRNEGWARTEVEMATSNNSCVLIEGPKWSHAGFCGKWLLAAAHADTLWKEARENPEFENQVQRVCVAYIPDFGIAASAMLGRLLKSHRIIFVLDLDSEDGDDFAMMTAMGFFAPYNERYRMSIPSDLSLAKVKEAILRYAETEDEEYRLHPEHLVNIASSEGLAAAERTRLTLEERDSERVRRKNSR